MSLKLILSMSLTRRIDRAITNECKYFEKSGKILITSRGVSTDSILKGINQRVTPVCQVSVSKLEGLNQVLKLRINTSEDLRLITFSDADKSFVINSRSVIRALEDSIREEGNYDLNDFLDGRLEVPAICYFSPNVYRDEKNKLLPQALLLPAIYGGQEAYLPPPSPERLRKHQRGG